VPEKVFGGQAEHEVAPGDGAIVPAGHDLQGTEQPSGLMKPGRQSRHVAFAEPQGCVAGHQLPEQSVVQVPSTQAHMPQHLLRHCPDAQAEGPVADEPGRQGHAFTPDVSASENGAVNGAAPTACMKRIQRAARMQAAICFTTLSLRRNAQKIAG